MDKDKIHAQLVDILTPLCLAHALDLWGIELLFGGGQHKLIRVYLDSDQGVSVEQCAQISRHLSLALDVEDLIPGRYTLEVSSPGLERPFFTLEQMQAYLGQVLRVRLRRPQDGRKKFKGSLVSIEAPYFKLEDQDTSYDFHWQDVHTVHLVHDFENLKTTKNI